MPNDRRARQKQARAAAREAAAKAKSRRELIRRISVALGLGAVVAVILLFSGTFTGDDDEVNLTDQYQAFLDQPVACDGSAPTPATEMSFDAPGSVDVTAGATATIVTSCGEIVIELSDSTQTVESFAFLAEEGYYDGTVFHRVVGDFVIQGGDPTATGRGGPGYRVPDEFPPSDFVYEEGVVAMANAGRGTTGSQFFIVIGDRASALPPTFNVLGRVVEGLDVARAIADVDTRAQSGSTEQSYPLASSFIESIEISEG